MMDRKIPFYSSAELSSAFGTVEELSSMQLRFRK